MKTFVKLYRKTLENELLANDNTAYIVFTKILLRVDWQTGEMITGRYKLSKLTNLKPTTCYAALKRLEKARMVSLMTGRMTTKYTKIKVLNWQKFQGDGQSDDFLMTFKRQSNDTINKNKRIKEEKNNTNVLGIKPQYGNVEVNKVMDCFEQSFGMKPTRLAENRKAAYRLIQKLKDTDKVCRTIQYAASIQGDKYSPSIGSVLDIEDKLIKLVAHSKGATERVYDAG